MEQQQLFDGKYRIIKILGQGGMSTVYLAENIKLGTLWAIKEINKKNNSKVDILVEPNILKKLKHPALPRVFDIIEDEKSIYVIVDYIEGEPLNRELARVGRFPEKTVIDWARQICEVLIYLHTYKPNPIIYRDMKPSNIILTKDGSIKLIDFGIAREFKDESESDTIYIGTRGYAAPEQYGIGQTSAVTDIYSLGITLYHLVTGKGPNEAPYELKPVRSYDKTLSQDIERIISRCIRQDPTQRYQSVQELLKDLEEIDKPSQAETLKAEAQYYTPNRPVSFKKLVLTIWDNAEFGCELAYLAAKFTGFSVLLADLDLLSPKADLLLNVKRFSENMNSEGSCNGAGINGVLDAIERNTFGTDTICEAAVRRKELKNLHILTGNYSLGNYEYYNDESLIKFLEKAYQSFEITILLVNRSIYDSYAVVSLIKSDMNILPVRSDIDEFREFNRYLMFLKEKQHIPLEKSKFVAFQYNEDTNLSCRLINEVTEHNYLGSVRCSAKRMKYRNLKVPYVRCIETGVMDDYIAILARLNIIPRRSILQMFRHWLAYRIKQFSAFMRPQGRKYKRGVVKACR